MLSPKIKKVLEINSEIFTDLLQDRLNEIKPRIMASALTIIDYEPIMLTYKKWS